MRLFAIGLFGLAAMPLLSACGGTGAAGSGPTVVAAFYPYAYVAQRVVGDSASVTNLTSPGLEPHDLELTPKQVAEIDEADVVIYQRGFQPAVDAAVSQSPPGTALDVAEVAGLESGADPHIWQDPTRLIPITRALAHEMAAVDPGHGSDYRSNARALIADLRRVDRESRAGLANCERREFVTSHAAFGYLAKRYGLTMIPIAGLSPDAEPSPQHLAVIQDLVKRDGITTIFSEVLGSKQYADTLAHDLGVRAAVLDPIEGLSDDDPNATYLSLMRQNLTALEKANGCS